MEETGRKLSAGHGMVEERISRDVWVSTGEPKDEPKDVWTDRVRTDAYQVNSALLDKAGNPAVKFMHCQPAPHDTNTVIGREIMDHTVHRAPPRAPVPTGDVRTPGAGGAEPERRTHPRLGDDVRLTLRTCWCRPLPLGDDVLLRRHARSCAEPAHLLGVKCRPIRARQPIPPHPASDTWSADGRALVRRRCGRRRGVGRLQRWRADCRRFQPSVMPRFARPTSAPKGVSRPAR